MQPEHDPAAPKSTQGPTRVTFSVDGDDIVADLYLPDRDDPAPALVLEGPLTSVKEQVTGNYAAAMAKRGFVALALDHRHFGESGGAPRQYEHPGRKVEDLRAALDYLGRHPAVDPRRLGAVGVCAGAGYLAGLCADEPRIKAWGAVAGFFHDASKQREWMGDRYEPALARAVAAREQFEQTGEAERIPAVGLTGEVAMPLREAFDYYGTDRGGVANYTNSFAVMSREHTLPWDAQSAAPRITKPTLMIHSEKALAPALARQFFAALAGPAEQLWVESAGQIDFYDRQAQIDPAADALARHFEAHL
ncbi:MAG: alpha/beta hydrolase [Myxococcales bacterium]|nr:alpha/beta hydrolase [Myxococcales bacterium]